MREPEILMVGKHLDRSQVGGAQVIDESGNVPVPVGVDAIRITLL